MSQKNVHLFIFWITLSKNNRFNTFWYVKSWENSTWTLTDLSTSPVRCSHFTLENPNSHFSTILFIYFRLFTLAQKKTNSNCCTAALAVNLLLFSVPYYLHSPSTASGARYGRSACIDMDMLRLAACCDMGWISVHCGVLGGRTVSKKTGSMHYCRRRSLWTLAVTVLAWRSCCQTSQPVFTARCYASAVLAMGLCLSVSVSVCLSVCLSQAGVLLKRLNVGSHKQHHTIPQRL